MKLTNKIMAEKLELPITRTRRWAKEFLPPDPRATRRSGYAREFSLNDGFFIYLGGTMVHRHNLTFDIAQKIIQVIKPWALCTGHVPDIPKGAGRVGVDRVMVSPKIWVYTSSADPSMVQSAVQIRGVKTFKEIKDIDSSYRLFREEQVSYVSYWLEPSLFNVFYEASILEFYFWDLLQNFSKKILPNYKRWVVGQEHLRSIEPDKTSDELCFDWIKVTKAQDRVGLPFVTDLME